MSSVLFLTVTKSSTYNAPDDISWGFLYDSLKIDIVSNLGIIMMEDIKLSETLQNPELLSGLLCCCSLNGTNAAVYPIHYLWTRSIVSPDNFQHFNSLVPICYTCLTNFLQCSQKWVVVVINTCMNWVFCCLSHKACEGPWSRPPWSQWYHCFGGPSSRCPRESSQAQRSDLLVELHILSN